MLKRRPRVGQRRILQNKANLRARPTARRPSVRNKANLKLGTGHPHPAAARPTTNVDASEGVDYGVPQERSNVRRAT